MLIRRYLWREISLATLAILLVLLFVLITAQFLHYLDHVASGRLTILVLMKLMGLEVPLLLGYLLPLAFFLAVLVTLSRMCVDNEMVILRSCGMGHGRLQGEVFKVALVAAAMTALLMFVIEPMAQLYRIKLLNWETVSYSVRKVLPGQFQQVGGNTIYVDRSSQHHRVLHKVFLTGRNKPTKEYPAGARWLLVADKATERQDPKTLVSFMELHHGYQYKLQPGQLNWQEGQFKTYGVRLTSGLVTASDRDKIKFASTDLLWSLRDEPLAQAELQWRLAMPLSVLLLSMIAVPLSYVRPREGKFGRFFQAILVYLVYANMLFVSRAWIEGGAVSYACGMWWLHGVALLFAFCLIGNTVGWRWLLRCMRLVS